jgi:hypothetical protein
MDFNISPEVLESFLLISTDKVNTRKAFRIIEDTNRTMKENGGSMDATIHTLSKKYSKKELENSREIILEFQNWLKKQAA